jgi:hypothetical protein
MPPKARLSIAVTLMTLMATALPLTSPRSANSAADHAGAFGLVSFGGAVVLWGVTDLRKASQPHTSVGVSVGRTAEIHVRRTW